MSKSYGAVAASVAADKAKRPSKYCPKCLWRLSSGPCPKHMNIAGQAIATGDGANPTASDSQSLACTPFTAQCLARVEDLASDYDEYIEEGR